jgi:uncharacterized protein YecT (DUF1311 family)
MNLRRCFLVCLFFVATDAISASFNCQKANSNVEIMICTNPELSRLDEVLSNQYKYTLNSSPDKSLLKSEQKLWLNTQRKNCNTDYNCLINAYKERIVSLADVNASTSKANASNNTVLGRCHMNVCWWWKVEKQESIQSSGKGKLIRVYTRGVENEYPDGNYPDSFPKQLNKSWGKNTQESYIFCSLKLPMYIAYNNDEKLFDGTIPFDDSGTPSGATEGVTNLYNYTCYGISDPSKVPASYYDIPSEYKAQNIKLKNPSEVFTLLK